MKRILWVGDAGCPSGFARATHEILNVVRDAYEPVVLGLNYRGDPHNYPYEIYAAAAEGDSFGWGRIIWMCDKHKPDVIVLQNDGWNIPVYLQRLRHKKPNGEYTYPDHAAIPLVAVIAVDGKNFNGKWLDGIDHAIFWTQFALDEARAGGYAGPASVIPLGVDQNSYFPEEKQQARLRRFGSDVAKDMFIVGNVNRNQPRKRWDLTVKYFAEWVKDTGIQDAWLYMHAAPTGDMTTGVEALMQYYGVDRLIHVRTKTFYGLPEEEMRDTYNCFDVAVSTTQGEGMGLTAMEAMACGVPCVLPAWSALADWATGSAWMVPCSTTAVGPPYLDIIGGVPDQMAFAEALSALYRDRRTREAWGKAGVAKMSEPRYRWSNIGAAYLRVLDDLLGVQRESVVPQEAVA